MAVATPDSGVSASYDSTIEGSIGHSESANDTDVATQGCGGDKESAKQGLLVPNNTPTARSVTHQSRSSACSECLDPAVTDGEMCVDEEHMVVCPAQSGEWTSLKRKASSNGDSCTIYSESFGDTVEQRKRKRLKQFTKHLVLSDLPAEILEIILMAATRGHADISIFKRVCKMWYQAVQPDDVWKRIVVRGWGCRDDIIQFPIKRSSKAMLWCDYYRQRLQAHRLGRSYLKSQTLLTVSVRAILINWMLAVVDESSAKGYSSYVRLLAHHRSVAFFDRYCGVSSDTIPTSELQKLGAACVVLGLRMEDPQHIEESVFAWAAYFTDGACSSSAISTSAKQIYNALASGGSAGALLVGDAPQPSVSTFLWFKIDGCQEIVRSSDEAVQSASSRLFPSCQQMAIAREDDVGCLVTSMKMLKAMGKDNEYSSTFFLTQYLGELALQSEVFLKYETHVVGAASFALACHTLSWSFSLWAGPFQEVSNPADAEQIYECIVDLFRLFRQSQSIILKCQEVEKDGKKKQIPHMIVKYCKSERQKVASVLPPTTLPPKWWGVSDAATGSSSCA